MIMINILLLEFNTLAVSVFNARLAQAYLVAKRNFDNTVSSLNNKTAVNKTKNEPFENELKKLKTFDSSYFIGKSHFEEDGKYFEVIANTDYVSSWKSKGYLLKLLSHLLHLIIVLLHY